MSLLGRIIGGGALDIGESRSRLRRSLSAYGRTVQAIEDRLIAGDLATARAACMDARRNNPIAAGLVSRFSETVVGAVRMNI